ncbi:nucleotide pyrophosphohydrolase [Dehalobacter sp.]|uniref:nucleotide pyrophosphohydrolase n=1 Tax=Dehalobacter sp. TaxID=1962289 RepID=UPI002591033D|nr:nucleotide pyrophosphohydrolase [Dehalobacter sp.]MCG1024509.1 nucleotide pyrophosphohydrolase [Dehalobacter sp.]
MNNCIEDQIIEFIRVRNWEQFHTPKNLVIALGAEVGELLECFQWKTDDDIKNIIEKNDTQFMADEIADIYTYLVSLCNTLNIDLEKAVRSKLDQNNIKYPVEKSYGTSKKYTEF